MDLLAIRHLSHHEISAAHAHPEGQMFTVQSGLVSIEADNKRWLMPPGCLGWVPPHIMHGAALHGKMRGMSLYFAEEFSQQQMPRTLKVVRTTPLLAALITEIAKEEISRLSPYLHVLADIFSRLPAEMLFLPMPRDPRLAALAIRLLQQPDNKNDLDELAQQSGMSRRTLCRHFQQETGWSVGHWRQQMRLLLALEKLASGATVTTVALDLGYQSVSAFISLFRQYLGTSPKAWQSQSLSSISTIPP